jgi:hypothetical protein
MGLRATLIAKKHLGALVAHEERAGGAELRRETGEHGALRHGEETRRRSGELDDDGRLVLHLDARDRFTEAASNELERDVARADERARASGEEDLHAARRPHQDRALRERLPEHARRHDDGEHADAADAGEPRLVGDAEARGAREALEVHGRREADAGTSDDDAVREHFGGGRLHLLTVVSRRGACDRVRVVDDRHLGGGLLQSGLSCFCDRAQGRATQHDLVDLDLNHVSRERRVCTSPGQNLLGHRAGRIPCSCAHRGGTLNVRDRLGQAGSRER